MLLLFFLFLPALLLPGHSLASFDCLGRSKGERRYKGDKFCLFCISVCFCRCWKGPNDSLDWVKHRNITLIGEHILLHLLLLLILALCCCCCSFGSSLLLRRELRNRFCCCFAYSRTFCSLHEAQRSWGHAHRLDALSNCCCSNCSSNSCCRHCSSEINNSCSDNTAVFAAATAVAAAAFHERAAGLSGQCCCCRCCCCPSCAGQHNAF